MLFVRTLDCYSDDEVIFLREHFRLALRNVTDHGDTDIFPYPVENRVFRDEQNAVLDLLEDYHANFQAYLGCGLN